MNERGILVHLDLKGAPPKVKYLKKLTEWLISGPFQESFKGYLIEYEDQFPFEEGSRVQELNHPSLVWNREELKEFLTFCIVRRKLKIIPLIQSLGHCEWILKKLPVELRELSQYCQCMRPLHKDGLRYITDIADQILKLHSQVLRDSTQEDLEIHIGGDEVWHLGTGEASKIWLEQRQNEGVDKHDLYLLHMSEIVKRLRTKWSNVKIFIWDDMFRAIPLEKIAKYKEELADHIEPVVWQYSPNLNQVSAESNPDLWKKYSKVFKSFSVGTAFKGASSSCAQQPTIPNHMENHLAWKRNIELVNNVHPDLKFSHCFMTGWQRFDHFSALCELLPVAIPSLVLCLRVWEKGRNFCQEDETFCKTLCKSFPGIGVYVTILEYSNLEVEYEKFMRGSEIKTWTNEWNIKTGQISRLHAEHVVARATWFSNSLKTFSSEVKNVLDEIYPIYVSDEWITTYISPKLNELSNILEKLSKVDYP